MRYELPPLHLILQSSSRKRAQTIRYRLPSYSIWTRTLHRKRDRAHGRECPEGPRYVRFLTRHRRAREASILHRLAKGEADIPTMVRAIYIGLDPRLTGAAGYSVLAHLEDLVSRGIVATDGDPVIGGTYRMAS
jgi:hypothetical protein